MAPLLINNISYDSVDEYYMACWLQDLLEEGIVYSYYREPYSIELSSGLKNDFEEVVRLKTKIKVIQKSQTLLRPANYTPDFTVCWNPVANGKLYQFLNTNRKLNTPFIAHENKTIFPGAYSLIENKPPFNQRNKTTIFINNQKFIWEKHKLFVNLIHTEELFQNTFTPKEYLLTPTGRQKKMNYKPITIKQFLQNFNF